MEQLDGKVAVVTGAGSGIGRSVTHRLAVEGMRVVAADVELDALAETASGAGIASTFAADVSNFDDVAALAEHVYEIYGQVDVLCNNAGVFAGGLMWERPLSDFTWTLGVNLWGILHGIRAFVPRMLAAGNPAHIVNTISMAGLTTNSFSGPYTISKFAAMAATECLAHDLAGVDAAIKVSAVVPGSVHTRIAASSRNRPAALAADRSDDATFVDQALHDLTTTQGASPDDVAAMIVHAIRVDEFLVPTRPDYDQHLRDRAAALIERDLPPIRPFG